MRYRLLAAVIFSAAAYASSQTLEICHGEYALCAASSTTPVPGKTVTVNGKTFPMGVSVCPVLTGVAIGNRELTNNSCAAPGKGKVWSLFSPVKSFPQAPSWAVAPAKTRVFTTTSEPGGGVSNMWSFPCDVRPEKVNSATLADCYGPMNESPWTSEAVPAGTRVVTDAAEGVANPVAGNLPAKRQAQANPEGLQICTGEYALCWASGTNPVPGKTITVEGNTFPLGVSVCPVLTGAAIGDTNLMNNSCAAPGKGKVWSLFRPMTDLPQAPSWAVSQAKIRIYTTTSQPGGGMGNMWSFPCDVRPEKVNGVTLADCFGPLNEEPFSAGPVPAGTTVITEAPKGTPNPVGGVLQGKKN
jgi:hypothetical protein